MSDNQRIVSMGSRRGLGHNHQALAVLRFHGKNLRSVLEEQNLTITCTHQVDHLGQKSARGNDSVSMNMYDVLKDFG
ncbi:hypothetical protein ACOSQ3_011329 [Xanthoceras sorbifolium]